MPDHTRENPPPVTCALADITSRSGAISLRARSDETQGANLTSSSTPERRSSVMFNERYRVVMFNQMYRVVANNAEPLSSDAKNAELSSNAINERAVRDEVASTQAETASSNQWRGTGPGQRRETSSVASSEPGSAETSTFAPETARRAVAVRPDESTFAIGLDIGDASRQTTLRRMHVPCAERESSAAAVPGAGTGARSAARAVRGAPGSHEQAAREFDVSCECNPERGVLYPQDRAHRQAVQPLGSGSLRGSLPPQQQEPTEDSEEPEELFAAPRVNWEHVKQLSDGMDELGSRAASCEPFVTDSVAPVATISENELTSETTRVYTRAEAENSIGALQKQVKALMRHLAKCDDASRQQYLLNAALRDQLTAARTARGGNIDRARESVSEVGALVAAAEKLYNEAQSTAAAGSTSSAAVSREALEASARRRQALAAELAQLQHGTASLSVDVEREYEREQFLLSQIHQLKRDTEIAQASLREAIKAHGLARLMFTGEPQYLRPLPLFMCRVLIHFKFCIIHAQQINHFTNRRCARRKIHCCAIVFWALLQNRHLGRMACKVASLSRARALQARVRMWHVALRVERSATLALRTRQRSCVRSWFQFVRQCDLVKAKRSDHRVALERFRRNSLMKKAFFAFALDAKRKSA